MVAPLLGATQRNGDGRGKGLIDGRQDRRTGCLGGICAGGINGIKGCLDRAFVQLGVPRRSFESLCLSDEDCDTWTDNWRVRRRYIPFNV